MPRKNKSHTSTSLFGNFGEDDNASSASSISTTQEDGIAVKLSLPGVNRRSSSALSSSERSSRTHSPRHSVDTKREVVLYREDQRVSLRAFLRTLLQNQQVASSKAIEDFLAGPSVKLNQEELMDVDRRKEMDRKRIEEQRQFYEVARQRAKELDIYMEKFRRDIVESSMFLPPDVADCAYSRRRPLEAFCGNQSQGQDRRPDRGVQEIR